MSRILTLIFPGMMCLEACGSTISNCLESQGIPQKNIYIDLISRECKIIIPDTCTLTNKKIIAAVKKVGYFCIEKTSNETNYDFSVSGLSFFLRHSISYIHSSLYQLFYLRQLTADNLFISSMIIMLTISIIGFAFPILQINLLFDIMLMLCTKSLSVIIQYYISHKNTGKKSILDRIHPDYPINDINNKEVFLRDLKIDSQFTLSRGDYIPIDATCNQDCSIIDTMGHGDILPITITQDMPLTQGMLINTAWQPKERLIFTVKKTYQQSTLSQLNDCIKKIEPPKEDSRFNFIFKNILYLVIFLAIITVIACHFYLLFPWQMTLKSAICVLTSACPCSLFANKSLVLHAVRSKLENRGILCKNIKSLYETHTDVVLDYTGTLTNPTPTHIEIVLDDQYKDIIYAMEKNKNTIFGKALRKGLESKYRSFNTEVVLEENQLDRSGISAKNNNITYKIGNTEMFHGEYDIEHDLDQHVIYIEKEDNGKKELIGHVKFTMELRSGAKEIIAYFQEQEIRVHICTGTDPETVKKSLEKADLNLNNITIKANKNPIEKLEYIKELQNDNKIVMAVGDGGNDPAFIAQANTGVAMHHENADSMTQAVSACCISNLSQLKDVKTITEEGAKLKNRNDSFSLGLNIIVMLFPMLSGMCYVWLGSLLMLSPLVFICCATLYYTHKKEVVIVKQKTESPNLMTANIHKGLGIITSSEQPTKSQTVEHKQSSTPAIALPGKLVNTPEQTQTLRCTQYLEGSERKCIIA